MPEYRMNSNAPSAGGSARVAPKKAKKHAKGRRDSDTVSRGAAVLVAVLAFYLIFSLFVAGIIYYSFNDTGSSVDLYSIKIVYDEKTLYTLSSAKVNNEYGLYVPFSYLTEICSFGLAGDGDDITIFIIGTDSRIECTKNSSLIVINGNPIRISAPILYSDGDYLIPVVLLNNYINGINVGYDDKKKVCTLSSDLGKTDVSLKLQLPDELDQAYFPDSYKQYVSTDEPSVSP